MKKFYLRKKTACASSAKRRIKALQTLFLALILSNFCYKGFSQVTVTPATDTTICSSTAATGGIAPACTTLGTITISETLANDFLIGPDQIVLNPPPGWQFCGTPTATSTGTDITATGVVTGGPASVTITFTVGGAASVDQIIITGCTSAPTGNIFAASQLGVPSLVTGPVGANFGTLGTIPQPIVSSHGTVVGSGYGICQFLTDTLTSSPGVTWTSGTPAVASIGASSGILTALSAPVGSSASTTITATLSGCSVSIPYTVFAAPFAITPNPARSLCAWIDTETFHDADPTGLFSSSVVSITNLGSGSGLAHAQGPGIGVIIYVNANGCRVQTPITVNPEPAPIATAPYQVCVGSTDMLTDSMVGGTWSTTNPHAAIIGSTGLLTGVSPGVDTVIYTLSTGCKTDTPFTVYANPVITSTISPLELCALASTTLSATPAGGTWSSSFTTVASVGLTTGVVTAGSVAIRDTTVITYTSSVAGCQSSVTLTVDPLPAAIAGPSQVCVGSTITLASSPPGGTWTSSNPGFGSVDPSTGVVTGIAPGVIVIVYTISPGSCTASYVVTVNAAPPPPTRLPAGTHACADPFTSFTFSDAVTPGAFTSSNPSFATIDSVTGVMTPISPGVVNICFTQTRTTGCSVCVTDTIDALPTPISGKDTFCAGEPAYVFTALPTGGTWTSSDPSRGSIDSVTGSFTPSITGAGPSITIKYTMPSGCFTSLVITINPIPPAITGRTNVCPADTIHLLDALTPGKWSVTPPTIVLDVDSLTGVVTGRVPGTGTVTYTSRAGCTTSFSVTVNVSSPIMVDVNPICQGDSELIHTTQPDFTGFAWSHTSTINVLTGFIADTVANFKALASGLDTIYYIVGGGPTACITSAVVTVDPIAPITAAIIEMCSGDTVTFHDPVAGGVWSNDFPTFGTINPATGFYTGVSLTSGGSVTDIIRYTMPGITHCFATYEITIRSLPDSLVGPDSLCALSSAQYVGYPSGGVSFVYSTSNPSLASIDILTGLLTAPAGPGGVDTITYTLHYPLSTIGCAISKTVTVEPLTPIITGTDSVMCYSTQDSLSFFDMTLGGTWSVTDPTVGTIDTAGVFKPVSPAGGVDTIYYTMPTGCQVMQRVTVNPLPSPIVGRDTLCQGDTVMLSSAPPPPAGFWFSPSSLVSVVSTTGVVFGNSAGVAIITYELFGTGCYVSRPVTVDVAPGLITGTNHVCLNHDTLLANIIGGGIWSTTNSAISTVDVIGRVHGAGVGTDTIIYVLPTGGCRTIRQFTVNPIPVITASPTPVPIKCKYASVALSVTGADSDPGDTTFQFIWTPSYGLTFSNPNNANAIANPTVTTTYTVVGTSTEWGCDSFTTITVFVDSQLNNIQIVGRDSICVGECDSLMASGRASTFFNWHPASGLSCTICDTVTACPNVTTTYWAVAIDDIGCKDSVSFTVTVNPLPVVQVDPNPPVVCKGRPLQLHARSPNTEPPTDMYVWTPNLFISCDTCFNPILTDTSNLVYRLTAYSQYGCHDSIDVKVTVLDTNINKIVSDTNICVGDSALLIASSHSLVSNLNIPTFRWMPTTGLSAPDSNVTWASPAATTTYSLSIHENACFDETLEVTVFVQPYPAINITTNVTGNTIVAGTPVQLAAIVKNTPVLSYAWTPTVGLTCDSCFNPELVTTVAATTYTVTVTSIYGCTSVDTITLNQFCDQTQIFVPNTFTPNGDGVNDLFFVSAKGIRRINLMQVYNRWGQMVFEAQNIQPNDPGKGWDGTFKGLVLEPDVFIYVIKAECEFGQKFNYTGDISLIR